MSEFSKQALKVENNTNFPNNSTGYITPVLLREFNTDMIDSTVNQTVYTEDSQSWLSSIEALNNFTASASGLNTGSLMLTASAASNVITFTKGDGTQFNVTVADTTDLAPLNAFTASAAVSINALNNFTSSNGISALNAYTSSNDTKWNNLGAQSGSWITESETGSFAKLDGGNTFNGNQIISGNVTTTGGFYGNGAGITGITASVSLPILDEGIPQGNAVSMNFTGSGISATIVGGTAVVSVNVPDASVLNALTASFNTYTGSNDAKVNSLIAATASYANSASVAAVDSAQQAQINSLIAATASVDNSITSLNSYTSSQTSINSGYNSYTSSNDTKWSNLGGQSGSWVTESETGSFARTDVSNTFTQAQTINADLNVSGTINAYKLNVTIESSSVIYSSGSNQFGDAANDTQTLYGSTNVVNELTASGLHYPTADNGVKSFMQTDGNGNLSLQYVDAVFETIRNMSGVALDKGTPVYISGSTGDNGNAYIADASDAAKMPAMYIVGEDLAIGATGIALVGGLIEGVNTTGYPAGTIIYVSEGGGWSSIRPSGSSSIVQVLGVVQKEGVGGQGVVINQLEATLPNIQTGYLWVGNGGNQPIAVATSSLVTTPTDISHLNQATASLQAFTASAQISIDNLNSTTASLNTSVSNLNSFTQSQQILNSGFATTGSNTFQGNQIINGALTASLTEGYVWAGGAGNVSTLVATSSFGGGGGGDLTSLNAFTASQELLNTTFATTGSNNFVGIQNIDASQIKLNSGSAIQLFDGASGTSAIQFWSGSNVTGDNPRWVNMQPQPGGAGTLAISAFPENNHFVFFNPATWQTQFESVVVGYGDHTRLKIGEGLDVTGSINQTGGNTTLNGNVTLTGSINQSGGTTTLNGNLNLTGSFNLTPTSVSTNANYVIPFISGSTLSKDSVDTLFYNPSLNSLQVSGSTGRSSLTGTGYAFSSGSGATAYQARLTKSEISQIAGTGYTIGISGNPSATGYTGLTTSTNPGIFATSGSGESYVAIELQASQSFTDGRVTIKRPLVVEGNLTASLQEGYVWVGNSSGITTTVATSSFGGGGAAFPYTGSAQITGSLGITGSLSGLPITLSVASSTASIDMRAGNTFILDIPTATTTHIVPTNIIAGQTINLLLRQPVTSGSVAWSPLVLFPSGVDMVATATGSAIDLVSMISFDTTNLMAANVKNLK